VMRSNFLAPVKSRAAAFLSDCSLSNSRPLAPIKSWLQQSSVMSWHWQLGVRKAT